MLDGMPDGMFRCADNSLQDQKLSDWPARLVSFCISPPRASGIAW